jgi:hypothetical protein
VVDVREAVRIKIEGVFKGCDMGGEVMQQMKEMSSETRTTYKSKVNQVNWITHVGGCQLSQEIIIVRLMSLLAA